LGADDDDFNALPDSGNLGRGDGRQSIVLGLFAGLAALRLVLQAFVVKEDLLSGSPKKWLAAINARNRSILKFRFLFNDRLRPVLRHGGFPPRFTDATKVGA
jgi:hypothetical protein